MSDRSSKRPSSHQHELETLRTLLSLPRELLADFRPRRPPEAVLRYVQRAPRHEAQWLLVDLLHRLRTADHEPPERNGRA